MDRSHRITSDRIMFRVIRDIRDMVRTLYSGSMMMCPVVEDSLHLFGKHSRNTWILALVYAR